MKEKTQIEIKLILSHILPVLSLVLAEFFIKRGNLLIISITQTILIILFLSGYWEFFRFIFKWIFCLTVEIILIIMSVAYFFKEGSENLSLFWQLILIVLQAYLLILLVKIIYIIFKNDKEKLEISFPFHNGNYLITDGGNSKISRLMNYHYHSKIHKERNTNKSMLYATDIIKSGNKSGKFIPSENDEYPVFGEKLYCPIDGTVLKVVNNIEDNKAFSGNYPYNTGNTIVIKKDTYYCLLDHLKKGSIVVTEGDNLHKNDFVAEAGNSGMSERPHLHMQVMKSDTDDYWKGLGICIQFKGKNLYKNRTIHIAND